MRRTYCSSISLPAVWRKAEKELTPFVTPTSQIAIAVLPAAQTERDSTDTFENRGTMNSRIGLVVPSYDDTRIKRSSRRACDASAWSFSLCLAWCGNEGRNLEWMSTNGREDTHDLQQQGPRKVCGNVERTLHSALCLNPPPARHPSRDHA